MSVKKSIDVNKLVITPKGEPYSEPIVDNKGRIKLEELDENDKNIYKFPNQLRVTDTPIYENKKIGSIITFALDRLDDKQSGEEIRKRFALSCRVEEAMQKKELLIVENKDWKCIESTLENVKNPLFNYRIQEAIDTAEVVKEFAVDKDKD